MSSQNWEEFNYPPLLHLWHYAPRELDRGLRFVARTTHLALVVALLALTVNLVLNIGLMVIGHNHGIHIMYAAFNLILGTILGMYTLMEHGYKGMATNKASLMNRYLAAWGVLTLGMVAASFLAVINFNGWARVAGLISRPMGDPLVQMFWLVGSAVESGLWTLAYLVSLVAMSFVYKINRDGPAVVRRMNRL